MTESTIIMVGAVLYVAVLAVISVYASRNIHNSADFVVAGRRLPLWLCVFTVFATWFGSGTLIGAAGAAYTGGLWGCWQTRSARHCVWFWPGCSTSASCGGCSC